MSAADAAEWLRLARQDLAVARLAVGHSPPLIEATLFHCQQVAEKALKRVIAGANLLPPRTHDLGTLLRAATAIRPGLAVLRDDAMLLTDYAVEQRYPSTGGPYSIETTRAALAAAEHVLHAVEEG